MKDISQNVKRIAFFNFFTEFKFYSPILVIVLATYTGNYVTAMSVISVMSLATVILEFPTGVLSDIVGKKTTVIIGSICNILGVLLWAIFPAYQSFLVGALLMGAATALFSGNNEALLFDSLKRVNLQDEYQKYLGKTQFTLQLALAITSILGAVIATWSMQVVLFLSVVPQILALLAAFTLIDPGHRSTTRNPIKHAYTAIKKIAGNRKLTLLTLARSLNDAFSGSSYQLQVAFINGIFPLWGVGLIRAFSNMLGAFSFYFSGEIIKRLSRRSVLVISNLYGRFSAICAILLNSFPSPFLLASSSAFFGASYVANSAAMQAEFSDDERATLGSIVSLLGSIMLALVSIFVGYLADQFSVNESLIVIQLFMFLPLVIYWRVFWRKA